MKKLLILLLLAAPLGLLAQKLIQTNEQLVFSFKTDKGKTLMIAKDVHDVYLIYRYGTDELVDMEYPPDKTNSWSGFKYSWYLRAGGAENEGMDLSYLYFTTNDFTYVVYHEDYAADKGPKCGIKVKNTKTGETTVIKGDVSSIKGSLSGFRLDNKVEITEELFEN